MGKIWSGPSKDMSDKNWNWDFFFNQAEVGKISKKEYYVYHAY